MFCAAQFALGQTYMNGTEYGVPKDENLGFRYLIEAAKNETDATSQWFIGRAQWLVARLYSNSGGCGGEPQCIPTSIMWCKKAAITGKPTAAFCLAHAYKHGLWGVPKSEDMSAFWLEHLVEQCAWTPVLQKTENCVCPANE